MGALTKRPKTPSIQNFIQPSVATNTPTNTTSTVSTSVGAKDTSAPDTSESLSEVRKESLLRRSRGRLGTVITGFRGLLSQGGADNQSTGRKTLLGE